MNSPVNFPALADCIIRQLRAAAPLTPEQLAPCRVRCGDCGGMSPDGVNFRLPDGRIRCEACHGFPAEEAAPVQELAQAA